MRRLRFRTVDRRRHGSIISLFKQNKLNDRDNKFGSGLCDVNQELELTVRKLLQIRQSYFCLCIPTKPSDRRTKDRFSAEIRTEFL